MVNSPQGSDILFQVYFKARTDFGEELEVVCEIKKGEKDDI